MDAEAIGPTNEAQRSVITSNSPKRLGLALSGGGFRATLFHLGVVRFLFDTGLLSRVHFIGGVSGGSILALHVGLHWDRYCSDHAGFDGAAREVLDFCQRDVRNRIIRRWLFGCASIIPRLILKQSRARLLISEYEHLFGNHTLNDLLPKRGMMPKPRIIAQSVSLTTGQPCSFGRSGYMWYDVDEQGFLKEREVSKLTPHLQIALAAAASSAFPPMFPPVPVTARLLHVNNSEFPNAQYLTDGGVYDNLGIERPLWYFEQQNELDAFIVADAGGTFDLTAAHFRLALPRNLRATDILMKRVGDLMYKWLLHRHSKHDFAYVGITDVTDSIAPGTLPPAVQRRVSRIRTDLDKFTDLEISTLIQHGYAVARKKLLAKTWVNANTPHCKWFPVQVSSLEADAWAESLYKSGKRSILPLFSLRDWPIWGATAVFICMLGLALTAYRLWIR
jgi:predicted acylesterase/phospholipase RssA